MCRSPPTKEATTSLWAGPSAHGRGIKADVRRRRPWYVSDWTDGSLFIAALVFVRTKYLPKKYDARTLELIDPLIDLAPIDKTPSTADLLEEGTPPPSPAPQVVSSPVRNRAGSA